MKRWSKVVVVVAVGCLGSAWWMPLKAEPSVAPFVFVSEEKAVAVVVVPDDGSDNLLATANDFAETVQQSTGVRLPVVRESEEGKAEQSARVYLGKTEAANRHGVLEPALRDEEYRMLFRDQQLFIIGLESRRESNSVPSSQPIRWALNRILEEQLGVRWLWPGSLGTYVPAHKSLSLPRKEITYQPELEIRKLRMRPLGRKPGRRTEAMAKMEQEAVLWAENHQGGRRGEIGFGHAFEQWWAKYGEAHPEYFAETPPGVKQPFLGATNVKIRLSNPEVIEVIAREYQEAGSPRYWSVCPNDRYGFDLSKATRAWDIPANLSKAAIWGGEANLTPRYVMFWNKVYERLRKINPEVVLTTYAYYSYHLPPPKERPLTAKCVIGYVSDYHDYDSWKGWADFGSNMVLRPNWWHLGADAPFIPNREMGDFIRYAWRNGMIGMDMDSIVGWWGTQGVNYYLVARLMTRPELSNEAILSEYAEAFGPAKLTILEYLKTFEQLSASYNYPAAGGALARLLKEGKLENRWAKGSHEALPHLWSEKVLQPSFVLLKKAEQEIGTSDPQALMRVLFLKSGLEQLRLKRELMQLSQRMKKGSDASAFRKARLELMKAREEWSKEHVIWGPSLNEYEDGYRIFAEPMDASIEELPLEM